MKYIITLLIALLASPALAREIVFAGGQSNAGNPEWGSGIESVLGPIVLNYHFGDNMYWWAGDDGVRNQNYFDDLAKVQAVFQSGDSFSLLWFQGEGDASFAQTYLNWGTKFLQMIEFYKQDLEVKEVDVAIVMIDLEFPPNQLWLDTVRDEQKTWPHIDSRGYPRVDGVHVTSAAARTLGIKVARRLRSPILGVAQTVPEPSCLAMLIGFLLCGFRIFNGAQV